MTGNAIKIKGVLIPIESVIPVEFYSPLFSREELTIQGETSSTRGKFSYPFNVTVSADIMALLGYPNLLIVKDSTLQFDGVELYSEGAKINTGRLQITALDVNLNNGSVELECIFIFNGTDFLDAIADKSIKELVLCGGINIDGMHFRDLVSYDDTYMGGIELGNIWIWRKQTDPGDGTVTFSNNHAKDWEYGGGDLGFRQVSIYCSEIVNGIENLGYDYFAFPSVEARGDETKMINGWFNGITAHMPTWGRFTETNAKGDIFKYRQVNNHIVPMFYCHQVLRHIFSEAGYTLKGAILDDVQFRREVVFNTHDILSRQIVRFHDIYGDGITEDIAYIEKPTYIAPSNHLPDVSQIDWLRDFMLKHCCYFQINGKEVTIMMNEMDQVTENLDELDPRIRIEPALDKGLTLRYDFPADDSYSGLESLAAKMKVTSLYEIGNLSQRPDDDAIDFILRNEGKIYFDSFYYNSNLIPYNSGKAKEFAMPIVPINVGRMEYRLRYIDTSIPDIVSGIEGCLPFTYQSISYREPEILNYQYDRFVTSPAFSPTRDFDVYTEMDVEFGGEYKGQNPPVIGFYYGLQSPYDFDTVELQYPFMSYYNYLPMNDTDLEVKLADWNLSILGKEGLVSTFWKDFARIFERNRMIKIMPRKNWYGIRDRPYNRSSTIRGVKVYISVIRFELPMRKYPVFHAYEL